MNDLTLKYLAFVVAASILIWGVLELNRRLYRRNKIDPNPPTTWIKLDAANQDVVEEVSPDEENDDQEETPASDIRIRAQQNGHHSESKKTT
jgi:hypothetical protein